MSVIGVAKKEKPVKIREKEVSTCFEYSIKMMRWLLQTTGMWPMTSPSYPNSLRLLLAGIVWLSLMCFHITYCLHMFYVVKSFQKRLRLIGSLNFSFMNITKFLNVLLRGAELRECVEWMATDWRSVNSQVENNLMMKNAKSARTFTIICMVCMYFGGMSYSAFFSFIANPIVVNNKTTRIISYPGYYHFFDPYDHFSEMYMFHATCAFIRYTITSAMASIAIACVMHVCGQMTVVSWMLSKLSPGSFDAVVFGRILQKHLRAITFAKKLEGYLNSICLIELMGCCINICMLSYYFILERKGNLIGSYTYFILLTSFIFNIFIFCYIGDQLTSKCGSIGTAAYSVNWYELSVKDARNLMFMIASTQRPIVLTAGKMAVLSLSCFTSVLKASFSYLNMLITVTNV